MPDSMLEMDKMLCDVIKRAWNDMTATLNAQKSAENRLGALVDYLPIIETLSDAAAKLKY